MPDRCTMHVISHTHWDREWYQTREEFRIRLVDLVDNVLRILDEDPNFRAFHLDGQTIALEDYLEIRPEAAERLRQRIVEGRLLLGPWHVLNDLYLTSGEATVRNLQLGMELAEHWGGCMHIGYLPDQFGNIGQMPQILRGLGIDNAIFGRGMSLVDDRKCEFRWESPDGSSVLAVLMAFWYNNAQRFPADPDEALAYTGRARDQLLPHCPSGHLLLMNGVDHLEAQDDLSPILAAVRERLPEGQSLVHSTMPEYIALVAQTVDEENPLAVHRGELREDRHGQVLAGTLSARMYLKQANDLCQRQLERIVEPLATLAAAVGGVYPHGLLRYAWRRLFENHPHDSICGCSIDETHADMEPRFRQVQQVGRELEARALRAVSEQVDTSAVAEDAIAVAIANTLPWERTDPVELVVDFPRAGAPHDVRVETLEGAEVPYSLLERTDLVRRDVSPTELPAPVPVRRFRLGLVARDVPAGGVSVLAVRPAATAPKAGKSLLERGFTLSNEYLRLKVEANGSLALEDLVSGATYTDLLVFEDGGDAGDEYNFRPPVPDRVLTTHSWSPTVTVLEAGPTRASVEIAGEWILPRSSSAGGRSPESVTCNIRSVVSLAAGVPRVEVQTTITNWAEDHRLRVTFPTDIRSDTLLTEGQYDLVSRPHQPPAEWPNASTAQPQQGFCAVADGHRGLCIVNEGLPEVELLDDARRTVALTLMRCVGVLSGGGEAQGVYDHTPAAQMLGQFTFGYGIVPFAGAFLTSGAPRQAHQQRVPLRHVQTGRHEGILESGEALLSLDPECLIPTATRLSPDGRYVVLRFFHAGDQPVEAVVRAVNGFAEASLGDLRERPTEALVPRPSGEIAFDVAPRKIVTLLLRPVGWRG
jgi:alpha-mannosidase